MLFWWDLTTCRLVLGKRLVEWILKLHAVLFRGKNMVSRNDLDAGFREKASCFQASS